MNILSSSYGVQCAQNGGDARAGGSFSYEGDIRGGGANNSSAATARDFTPPLLTILPPSYNATHSAAGSQNLKSL